MSLAILIMAAGQSQRFGSCKQLADLNGKVLLQHVIETAQATAEADIYVVTGHWHQQISEAQHNGDLSDQVSFLYNPDWREGLGNSLSFGFNQLSDRYQRVLVLLADQVCITPEELQQLLRAQHGYDLSCAFYQHKRGVPAVFGDECFPALRAMSGIKGAKALLNSEQLSTTAIEIASAVLDIDTVSELERLRSQTLSYS